MSTETEQHQEVVERFIALANEIKSDGLPTAMISDAMMVASAFYATYVAAGNQGGLTPTGVEKVVARYKQRLEWVQKTKKQSLEEANK